MDFATTLETNLQQAKFALVKTKERQTSHANNKRRNTKFKVGDKVRLSTNDLSFSGNLSRKLLPKFTRPCVITKVISLVVYGLDLPTNWKTHNVFHVSKLKPYREPNDVFNNREQSPPSPTIIDGQEEFRVETIL